MASRFVLPRSVKSPRDWVNFKLHTSANSRRRTALRWAWESIPVVHRAQNAHCRPPGTAVILRRLQLATCHGTVLTMGRSLIGFLFVESEVGVDAGMGFLAALAADPRTSKKKGC